LRRKTSILIESHRILVELLVSLSLGGKEIRIWNRFPHERRDLFIRYPA